MKRIIKFILLILIMLTALAACDVATPQSEIVVSLRADGRERTFAYTVPVTVSEFLQDSDIELGELDRVNPELFTQITDGMIVTVIRVEESTVCEDEEIPFQQRTVPNEGLQPDEERLGQVGENGTERVCYRVRTENEVEQPRIETSRVVLEPPQDEVIYVGPSGTIDPVAVIGTLAYLSNGNAWVIRGNSTAKRPVTTSSDLDEMVFSISSDGDNLLYTRNRNNDAAITEETVGFANSLWAINEVGFESASPIELIPQDVLQAQWLPTEPNAISYSTGESTDTAPGWRAYNDLWTMRYDPQTGESVRIERVIEPSSFGLYSWWGTQFHWSPSGQQLAWIRADSMGLVDLETRNFETILEYPVFNTRQSWSWRATVSWTEDESLIATTIHVPFSNYPPETSPAFSVAVTDTSGSFSAEIIPQSGIWSVPQFSPTLDDDRAYLAYLLARDPFNSINGEYDLIVADQDSSNAKVIFPADSQQQGLRAQEFVWSPDGRQIAVIYFGNLWIVDAESGVAHQLTLDGGASQPQWAG